MKAEYNSPGVMGTINGISRRLPADYLSNEDANIYGGKAFENFDNSILGGNAFGELKNTISGGNANGNN